MTNDRLVAATSLSDGKCGLRNAERGMSVKSDPEPVAATVPLDLRFRIGRKPLTEVLTSMRPQTAVAIGPHYVKREWQIKPMTNNNHPNR